MKKLSVKTVCNNNIKHIYIKKVNKLNNKISMIMCGVLMLFTLGIKYVDIFDGYDQICAEIYNPINSLYNENNGIVFASKNLDWVDKNKLKFVTPIKCGQFVIEDGVISYTIDSSIMVIAPESGIVTGVGYLPNGEKYIEITHSSGVKTRIENIFLTGVVNGQVVAKGKDIATVKLNEIVKFSIYENNEIITNIKLNKNQIEWQNLQ